MSKMETWLGLMYKKLKLGKKILYKWLVALIEHIDDEYVLDVGYNVELFKEIEFN